MASSGVSTRNAIAKVRYFARNPPPEALNKKGAHTFKTPLGATKEQFKEARHKVTEEHEVTFHDARTAIPGGLASWSLDTHGFTVIPTPPPVDFADKGLVIREYYPKLLELAKKATGAKEGFMMSYAVRTEDPVNNVVAYARFAHTDAGPGAPEGWRGALVVKGVPEEEAMNCDICMYNIWHPIDRPAYSDPLCLLDASTVLPKHPDGYPVDVVRYTVDNGMGMDKGLDRSSTNYDPTKPKAKKEQPKLMPMRFLPSWMTKAMDNLADPEPRGPLYSPGHRWVYISDMKPEEAWLFKQYDTREGLAKSTFHTSFHDPVHDGQPKETHGRRSCEFRLLLTFDKAPSSKL